MQASPVRELELSVLGIDSICSRPPTTSINVFPEDPPKSMTDAETLTDPPVADETAENRNNTLATHIEESTMRPGDVSVRPVTTVDQIDAAVQTDAEPEKTEIEKSDSEIQASVETHSREIQADVEMVDADTSVSISPGEDASTQTIEEKEVPPKVSSLRSP